MLIVLSGFAFVLLYRNEITYKNQIIACTAIADYLSNEIDNMRDVNISDIYNNATVNYCKCVFNLFANKPIDSITKEYRLLIAPYLKNK